jgi:hypothetical protein
MRLDNDMSCVKVGEQQIVKKINSFLYDSAEHS